jgi:GT2 family glycosyltransferase
MLIEAVRSVLGGSAVPSELLVVDQSDVPNRELRALGFVRGCEIRYLHSASVGVSRARNIGLRAARSEVVVLIDDDMLAQPEWLQRLLEGYAGGGSRTVATGRVLASAPEGGGRQLPPAALFAHAAPATYRGRQPLDRVPGANVALPRALALGLGGFDERFGAGARFASAEDNDMGFRLLEAGCEVRHVPEATVLHQAWRSWTDLARLRWSYGRGKGAFYAKHASLRDRHMLGRMATDARMRVRSALGSLPSSPMTSTGQLVYLAGLVSGALEWWIRESRTGASHRDAARPRRR